MIYSLAFYRKRRQAILELAWINGDITELAKAKCALLDRGYFFGDGVYEVIRVYKGQPFTLDFHLERLAQSASSIRLNLKHELSSLRTLVFNLLAQANIPEAEVYMHLTRGVAPRQHAFPSSNTEPVLVITVSKGRAIDPSIRERGIKAISVADDRWAHCNIKSLNLLPNILAKQKAHDEGAYEAIFIRNDNKVSEGSSSNVLAVINDTLVTPLADEHILNGVTRRLCLTMAKKKGFPTQERNLELSELLGAQEIFITSTTMEIIPVINLNGISISDEKPGFMTKTLFKEYHQLIQTSKP